MIQLLATKYNRFIAFILLMVFCCSYFPVLAAARSAAYPPSSLRKYSSPAQPFGFRQAGKQSNSAPPISTSAGSPATVVGEPFLEKEAAEKGPQIGGPTQPEMSSFRSVGTDNMVNLFTGDFSYNIPLMDVGGYPINIFYDGGITMEQEASWVGLGWNINPGTINRNMRGVPDDFNGEDTLVQLQNVKPNNTWGATLGADLEVGGIKDLVGISVGGSVGLSFNNYLGPALERGLKGGLNFKVAEKVSGEKSSGADTASLNIGVGLQSKLSSRSGLTLSPSVSLTSTAFLNNARLSNGLSLSTGYNSRTGIKALQLSEQTSFNSSEASKYDDERRYNQYGSISEQLAATTISFVRPSYVPSLRMPLTNRAYAGHFQLGLGIFGVSGTAEIEGYQQSSTVAEADVVQQKPMFGYLHYQKAKNNHTAVLDFTRFNDREVTARTPIISVPQYTYDVFSIQGEGTGGSIRAYRSDLGYVRDPYTQSRDASLSVGADVGVPGHYGANFNTIKTPTSAGEWRNGNKLRTAIGFKESTDTLESVYFRNPGESTVLEEEAYRQVGGTDLVRFKLGGTTYTPSIEPVLERFSADHKGTGTTSRLTGKLPDRTRRTQVVSFLTAEEAKVVGLDTAIRSYSSDAPLNSQNQLNFQNISRVSEYRKKHHISEISVLESNGRRYVYGIPVYNQVQKDFTFSVKNSGGITESDTVLFHPGEPTTLNTDKGKDGFLQITQTPPYAHAYLLTGLLSPGYVDVSGNGITEDDLGESVKFNYTRIKLGTQWAVSGWRTPLSPNYTANFNAGHLTEGKDDKGLISYGERESWYVHSIESKTMVALFTLEERRDGKGAMDSFHGIKGDDKSVKRLKKIDLYSKADLKKNGLTGARPIKTAWFAYSYTLCANTPGNTGGAEWRNGVDVNQRRGKLTLDSIYFTFNGKERLNKNKYVFSYTRAGEATVRGDNPDYEFNGSDRWGNYKPRSMNPQGVRNSEFPYTIQDTTQSHTSKQIIDANAGAWSLKRILLPSGGQIEVGYESDDYAYVQDRRAAAMMKVAGFGSDPGTITNRLYRLAGSKIIENNYVFIKLPRAVQSREEAFSQYLQGLNQLAFKLMVRMPKGYEYLPCYATFKDYGLYDATHLWIKLDPVDGISPLSLTAVEHLREQLPGQAFEGYDVSDESGLKQVAEMLIGMLMAVKGAFKNPLDFLRSQGKAQGVDTARSFVRLNVPDGCKYGGGHRVKWVTLKDNWDRMTGQYGSEYGQQYEYTTTAVFNGKERTISSGVASYEPTIGGEENPFQNIVRVADKLPLGPTSYGAIEMPVLDAFFPAPVVGYSKVTVQALRRANADTTKKSRSGIGRQVTEFYTAKDYPVFYDYTTLDMASDLQAHQASQQFFFYKYAFDSRALSQGFLVATNDMHGKLKSQSSYAQDDPATRIHYTENFYRNTGKRGLDEQFDFVHHQQGGVVKKSNMGVDIELMTDTREFSVKSTSLEVQGQVDLFPIFLPFWLPFIWPVSGNSENTYRAVTTTKVINYHGVLDSVVVIDKGSMVSTKNQVYDAQTGQVVVSRTNNAFDDPVFQVNYPAYWAYSGMGLAYKNLGAGYSGVTFYDGRLTSPRNLNIFESGDELYVYTMATPADGCAGAIASPNPTHRIWVFDKNKSNTSLTVPLLNKDLVFMDAKGKLFTANNVSFKIVRSGKRNFLAESVAQAAVLKNPIQDGRLVVSEQHQVVAASAVTYKEKWSVDCQNFATISNPYQSGLLGNFKPYKAYSFYGSRMDSTVEAPLHLRHSGSLAGFKPYWDFNEQNHLVPDASNPKWVWNSELENVNTRGLEIETRDALNRYTSVQYGFFRNLPLAVVQNARESEMAYEGFEEEGYNAAVNEAAYCAAEKKFRYFDKVVPYSGGNANAYGVAYTVSDNGNGTQTLTVSFAATPPGTNATTLSWYNGYQWIENTSGVTTPRSITMPVGNWSYRLTFLGSTSVSVELNEGLNREAVKPHSGQKMMLLTPGSRDTIPVYVNTNATSYNTDSIRFAFPTDSIINVRKYGGEKGVSGTATIEKSPGGTFSGELQNNYLAGFNVSTSCPGGTGCAGVSFNGSTNLTAYYIPTQSSSLEMYLEGKDLFSGACNTSAKLSIAGGSVTIYDKDNNVVASGGSGGCAVTGNLCKVPISEYSFRVGEVYRIVSSITFYGSIPSCSANSGYSLNILNYIAIKGENYPINCFKNLLTERTVVCSTYTKPVEYKAEMRHPSFGVPKGKTMLFSAWVREECGSTQPCDRTTYEKSSVVLKADNYNFSPVTLRPVGNIIEGWQKIEGVFTVPEDFNYYKIDAVFQNEDPSRAVYFDDVRIHPFNAQMKSYVYDPVSLRLTAELDANNYATFYEYDEEGTLIRTKAETSEGVKTLNETRSYKQTAIKELK